jgi:hypothetical protein
MVKQAKQLTVLEGPELQPTLAYRHRSSLPIEQNSFLVFWRFRVQMSARRAANFRESSRDFVKGWTRTDMTKLLGAFHERA